MRYKTFLMTAAALAAPCAAWAQSPAAAPPAVEVAPVTVRALPLNQSEQDVASHVAVLDGDELVQRRQATLGETLAGVPGVSSDTFGGGASRPVIRGQTSPRVKVLSDGAELIDASAVSPDHAVAGETLLLDGIEILHGPNALLYGGGAIGGAVNLLDRKIPTEIPAGGVDGAFEVRGGTADDERAGVFGITAGAGNFAVRLEGAVRRSDDYEIPSYLAPHEDHDEHEEDHDDHDHDDDHGHEDHDEHEEHEDGPIDRVAGSFNDTSTLTLGASWVGARGWFGAAVTEQRSTYGLPGHAHEFEDCHPHGSELHCGGHDDHGHEDEDHGDEEHDHDHDHGAEETPYVKLHNRRLDVRGELNDPMAGIERIRFRGGLTDYEHAEIEDGEIGTVFRNDGHDARVEVEHAPIAGLRGVVGYQTSRSDFIADGEEGFLPQTETHANALFLLEQYDWGPLRLEGAVRQEWQETRADGLPDTEHTPLSLSGAVVWRFADGWAAAVSASRSQRAPNVQELYADGVHLATNTYEVGDATLTEETANTLEFTLRKTRGDTTLSLGAYRHAFDDYIYARTLDQIEEFRLIQYAQEDAVFTGVDGEVRHQLSPNMAVTAFGDYVQAELDQGGDLPRIPAARLGLRADGGWNQWSGEVEYYRVFEQDRIAAFESVTPGYDMVNMTVAYDFSLIGSQAQLFLRGSNLLDEVALNHASFIKDSAPLRGRNFVVGLRTTF